MIQIPGSPVYSNRCTSIWGRVPLYHLPSGKENYLAPAESILSRSLQSVGTSWKLFWLSVLKWSVFYWKLLWGLGKEKVREREKGRKGLVGVCTFHKQLGLWSETLLNGTSKYNIWHSGNSRAPGTLEEGNVGELVRFIIVLTPDFKNRINQQRVVRFFSSVSGNTVNRTSAWVKSM